MSNTIEIREYNKLLDAISGAVLDLAKAKEMLCLTDDTLSCDDYSPNEAFMDLVDGMNNDLNFKTQSGKALWAIMIDYNRIMRYVSISLDYVHKTLKDLHATAQEVSQ